jgi:hypothetical protein
MNNEPRLLSVHQFDRDPYASSRARERGLNAAIIQAEISESFEKYLEILDVFYGDDIEVSSETGEEPIRGMARVRALLANFLVPLHVMAEAGGLFIHSRDRDSWRCCRRDAFRLDSRIGRRVR